MRIDVYVHDGREDAVLAKLTDIESQLATIMQKEVSIMADLTNITQAVADTQTVEESAITLLTNLSSQIESLKNDPVALQGLADSLNTEKDKLAAAITANTPAA